MYLTYLFKEYRKRKAWRYRNKNNSTYIRKAVFPQCIHVGIGTYGELNVEMSRDDYHLHIGNYCSIAADSKFILSSDHPTDLLSTFPFNAICFGNNTDAVSKGNIVVKDDVWIGSNTVILSGVTIGQGAVVAAGSVVAKDVPPYAIVGGIPAKVLKYRFSEEVIKKLMNLDYSALTNDLIKEHINDLKKPVGDDTDLSWFPCKSE